MLSILSDTQKAIVETITMRLHPPQALQYLEDLGYKMSRRTYFRHKKQVEDMKIERMQYIALHFQDQHLERVDKVELIEKLMWENYHLEKDPTKKVNILGDIITMQGNLAAYYDVTRYVLERTVKTEADYFKQRRHYFFTDVREEREKEVKEDAEKRRFQTYNNDREAESAEKIRQDLEVINRQDDDIHKSDNVNFATVHDDEETETEDEKEAEEEIIGRPWTKAEAYRAAAKVNKNNNNKTIFTS